MPETRSTIGSGGGRDYSTLAGWDASLPSDTAGTAYIGDLYADSEFVSAGVALDFNGIVTTPLGPIIVRAADGESFVDNASIRTTALAYDTANGVAIRNTAAYAGLTFNGSAANVIFERIQFKGDDANHYDFIGGNFMNSGLSRINQCLFYGRNAFVSLKNPQRVNNSVFLKYGTGTGRMALVQANYGYASWTNCTLFAASDASSPTAAFSHNYVTLLATNVAAFGCTNVEDAGGGTFTATNGATDDTTPPTGFTGSLALADQFEVVTTSGIDARVKSGADLIDAGTALTPDIFPVVWGTADGSQDSNATSHTITLPTHASGQLLVVVFSVDGNPTVTVNTGSSSSGWTKLGQASNSTVVTQAVFYKTATSASEALVLTTDASEQSTHISYVIKTYLPAAAFYVTGTSANGSSTNSDPPAETPAYGRSDYLWIATRGGDSTVQATVAPTNFSPLRTRTASGTQGASTATAENYAAFATTVNPGTWTSATEQWVCYTLGIRATMAFEDISGTAFTVGGTADIGAWEYSAGGTTYEDTITDSVTVAETVAAALVAVGSVSDAATAAEAVSAVLATAGTLTDAATVADAISATLTAVGALADPATVADSLVALLATAGSLSDAATLAESVIGGLALAEGITDAATLGETLADGLALAASVTDAATLGEALAAVLAAAGSVADGATLAETIGAALVAQGSLSDGATLADLITALGGESDTVPPYGRRAAPPAGGRSLSPRALATGRTVAPPGGGRTVVARAVGPLVPVVGTFQLDRHFLS